MAKTARRTGWWMLVALTATAGPVSAGEANPAIVARVDNRCALSTGFLRAAQDYATSIYDSIGVSLAWASRGAAPSEGALELEVVFVPPARVEQVFTGGAPRAVLGAAVHQARRAYIFCDRIFSLVRSQGVSLGITLGRVLAHELGHIVLPAQGHSATGIMRASLDYRSTLVDGFTPMEADAIHALLDTRSHR